MSLGLGFKILGADRARRVIARLNNRGLPNSMQKGMNKWAENVMGESKREVPVDTGALRSTGRVERTRGFAAAQISLVYGGGIVNYAVFVHEDLNARHKVGKAKYLGDPINRNLGKLPDEVRRFLRVELRVT